jgi:hypothetical protein
MKAQLLQPLRKSIFGRHDCCVIDNCSQESNEDETRMKAWGTFDAKTWRSYAGISSSNPDYCSPTKNSHSHITPTLPNFFFLSQLISSLLLYYHKLRCRNEPDSGCSTAPRNNQPSTPLSDNLSSAAMPRARQLQV